MGHAKKFCPMDEEGQYVQKDSQLVEKFGEWMRCSPLKKSFGRKFQVPAVAPRAVCALNFSGQQLLKAQAGSVVTPSHTHNTLLLAGGGRI